MHKQLDFDLKRIGQRYSWLLVHQYHHIVKVRLPASHLQSPMLAVERIARVQRPSVSTRSLSTCLCSIHYDA
jgi:hypothetical protein